MCGIAGIFGTGWEIADLEAMVASQRHRGPDATGMTVIRPGIGLGHTRLSIIDRSSSARQPMVSRDQRLWVVFNGEIYNYLELRAELSDYPYSTRSDTEVLLAAYDRWGAGCLDRLLGMFAFFIWDDREQCLFGARDRFGVKPLHYSARVDGTLFVASEIKAIHAAGVPARPDERTWATYLANGVCDQTDATFWEDIRSLPPGHSFTWNRTTLKTSRWYDLAERSGREWDGRPIAVVQDEYTALLKDSVRLRFRSDVPVGINLSGGLDSSTLLGLVHSIQGSESDVKTFTFITGSPEYDELPWVRRMLACTRHQSFVAELGSDDVPALAESVHTHEDEPFGGMPTLAYARLFERARAEGVVVLLDGQGLDEQWAGYDYYRAAVDGKPAPVVQGTTGSPVRPDTLNPEFRRLAEPACVPTPFDDTLRNLQYRDARFTKIPRALRFNDRASMRASTELREPFLDHRLFELALRQPPKRKIADGQSKWLLRHMTRALLPASLAGAPKRPVQTPQREWLRGPLRSWAYELIDAALRRFGGIWLERDAVLREWRLFCDGGSDNSFYIWQWISIGLMVSDRHRQDRLRSPIAESSAVTNQLERIGLS